MNYHHLSCPTLQKLTYRTLAQWNDRQKADAESGVPGAGPRLNAAHVLQAKLAVDLGGRTPYDIHVRWKDLADQPLGWEPDLDEVGAYGLNIRPLIEAEVLRSKFTTQWKKRHQTLRL